MLKREVVFGACAAATPAFAAKLANVANRHNCDITLEQGCAHLSMDSLISILALDLRRGVPVTVCASGPDEAEAVDSICALLLGPRPSDSRA